MLFNPLSKGSFQFPSAPTCVVFSEITVVPSGFLTVTLTVAPGVPVPVNSSSVERTVFLALAFVLTTGATTVSFSTITFTGTSSLDPSGYVTTTVASFSPGVAVSTGSLKATFVPLGRSFTFPIESSAFGVVPLFTVCGLAVGVFLSASVGAGFTRYAAAILSFDPSG